MNSNDQYLVVARKYRPNNFSDLVGQSQVATALGNAIQQNRVGHAYLFTGARGVGKTSSARIFAKCLNCQQGPTTEPCDQCDVCLGIASGQDVDVLEIDGASNRGIDEIRQLRSNANVRPSRARNKIYIIDEVHMLTTQAFNALLKTLEEPPGHVKFIFCTTDPEKIPITVLSRCQRFDFPPILTEEIKERLRQIVETEGMEAENGALDLLARRARGSMRDSQSLLEQLLSFTTGSIRESDVHAMLGTADFGRVFSLIEAIVSQQPAQVLSEVGSLISDGVDAGQLAEQLLGLVRDLMARKVGCQSELMLHTSKDDLIRLDSLCERLGLEKILAILQMLDQALIRMRQSSDARVLLETATVRLCHLEDLDQIPKLLQQLRQGAPLKKNEVVKPRPLQTILPSPVLPTEKAESSPMATPNGPPVAPLPVAKRSVEVAAPTKQVAPVETSALQQEPVQSPPSFPAKTLKTKSASTDSPPIESVSLKKGSTGSTAKTTSSLPATGSSDKSLPVVWRQVLADLGDISTEVAGNYERLEMTSANQISVILKSQYDCQICCRADRKARLEQAVGASLGRTVRIDFTVSANQTVKTETKVAPMTKRQRIRLLEKDEFMKKVIELFDVEILDVKPASMGKP